MSRPRAATSVAIKILKAPLRNAAIVFSRRACGMSPCSARRSKRSLSESTISLHSFFVSQKMMLRFSPPPCAATTSLITSCICVQWPQGTHICLTSVEACIICSRPSERPTRSISVRCVAYSLAIFWTHGGNVAEKKQQLPLRAGPGFDLAHGVEDLVELVLEAHVQHLVRLIEDGEVELGDVELPFLDQVVCAPGRADDDVYSAPERVDLGPVGRAAVDADVLQAAAGNVFKLGMDLQC
mmetsp:Transcript_5239/g.18618  ORF Transcript_5239/g.18618 Transcript_5239/m.18618 type:complete len:240 (-) Transcript_5239:642-1361(-)